MYLCFECPPAIFCTEVNRRLIFCNLTVQYNTILCFVARTTSYVVTLRSKMFEGSIFLFLTADVLQEYVNTKTLGLWRGDWLHVSFAKCGTTLTKCRHHHSRRKKLNLPSKVLHVNTNKSNKSINFYHHGSKTGLGLSPWMLI